MTTDAITREIVINASPETVYDVVSRPEHIVKWFSDEADFQELISATADMADPCYPGVRGGPNCSSRTSCCCRSPCTCRPGSRPSCSSSCRPGGTAAPRP